MKKVISVSQLLYKRIPNIEDLIDIKDTTGSSFIIPARIQLT